MFISHYNKNILSIILFIILTSNGHLAKADDGIYESGLNKLISNGGFIAMKEGRLKHSYNPDRQFIPASIWKIVISLAALETLGEGYRFKTEFYLDKMNNLYIKGLGDPFLVSEEIDLIFKEMNKKGIFEINNIYLDDSSFNLNDPAPGVSPTLNPYDVKNGALAVNFNTINFYVDANGSARSAEDQTPTVAIMRELGRGFKKGTHRINISNSSENVIRHAGELFRAFQAGNKIPGRGIEKFLKTPDHLQPFYIHHSSKTLIDVIKSMMLYSNNYIANQIYLTLGSVKFGYPATWEKSRISLREYIDTNLGEYSNVIIFDEGSGISRNNRITVRAMLTVLERFKHYAGLLPLEKGAYIKSGTLKGVYSYAGYIVRNDEYDAFVIILNQDKNNRERILDLIR